ncbi:MAG: replication initiation negative regulator SeqA [Firmicutes bacterium]|nr:replication initiation negative regulator SeqA [Bacillota bacterium]
MDKLLMFLRDECPEEAIEIQECIRLLNQAVEGCIEAVKQAVNKAFDQRDYQKLEGLRDLLETVDGTQEKLEYCLGLLQLEDSPDASTSMDQDDNCEEITQGHGVQLDPNIAHTLCESYTNKRPAGFEIFGTRHEARNWKDVLIQTCEILSSRDPILFSSFVGDEAMQGRTATYFAESPEGLRSPRKVKGTNIYVMTNLSANQIRNVLERILKRYGIGVADYKVFLRADYAARPL